MPVSLEELAEQGVSCTLSFAARALGIGESSAYTAVRNGNFPCRVIKIIGGRYSVPTAELRAVLGQLAEVSDGPSLTPHVGGSELGGQHRDVLVDLLGRIKKCTDSTDTRNYAEAYAFIAQNSP